MSCHPVNPAAVVLGQEMPLSLLRQLWVLVSITLSWPCRLSHAWMMPEESGMEACATPKPTPIRASTPEIPRAADQSFTLTKSPLSDSSERYTQTECACQ